MKLKVVWILALLVWLVGTAGTLLTGSYPNSLALSKLYELDFSTWNPIFDERVPRWIILSLSGSSLAVAGAGMQALFGNPLASPSSLGIASGASLLIVLAYATGFLSILPISLPLLAFIGSLITLLIVHSLSQWRGGGSSTLLLVGLATTTLLSAIESTLIYSMRDNWELVRTLYEWSSASSLDRSWSDVALELPFCLVGMVGIWMKQREIDIISLGEEQAQSLGIPVEKVRAMLFFYISLIIGATLASIGSLPFFGLLLPHLVRIFSGPRHRKLLPLCFVAGAGLLCLLDWSLRVSQLHFLSLGNVCAVTGAAGFMIVFLHSSQRSSYG